VVEVLHQLLLELLGCIRKVDLIGEVFLVELLESHVLLVYHEVSLRALVHVKISRQIHCDCQLFLNFFLAEPFVQLLGGKVASSGLGKTQLVHQLLLLG